MSRYTGPKVRKMRELGTYLSGLSGKSMEKRSTRPGQHGHRVGGRKQSDFGAQLHEKQKLQFNYGLRERQLSRLVKEARKSEIATGDKLAELLERRLDNVVFRAGFALTIPAARQLVAHGHIRVNGKRVDIASYRVDVGDVVGPKPKSQDKQMIRDSITSMRLARPNWLQCNYAEGQATVLERPTIVSLSVEVDIARVIEYYAKRG